MVTLEGMNVKAKVVSRREVISAWKGLTIKPFPKVIALRLKDEDFNRYIGQIKCPDDERREIHEWGRILSIKGTDACVYQTAEFVDVEYIILIRENPYHSIAEILKHELSHIVRGDL